MNAVYMTGKKWKSIPVDCLLGLYNDIYKERDALLEEVTHLKEMVRTQREELEFLWGSSEGMKLLAGGDKYDKD